MLDGLNQQQAAAVEAGNGPVMIVAGSGTGKTKTLTTRIAYLIQAKRAAPQQILALTFTKKAAEEMRQRVATLVDGAEPRILTFHALCHQLLQDDTPFVGDLQRLQIIKNLPRSQAYKGMSARELGLIISRAKNQPDINDSGTAKLVQAYNSALAEQNVRDFDDLLLQVYQRLRDDEAFRTEVQARYTYVLVDEFQDTNRLQYELLRLLLNHTSIFVIGDPNQSIYGFRGASGTIFDQFRTDFPDCIDITLTTNYRSVPQIVRLSNAIFPDTLDLQAHSETPGLVRAVEVLNEYGEAAWVLTQIQQGIGGGDMLKAVSDDTRANHRRLSDFAIVYRSRPAAIAFQKLLAESGLPYQVVGDGSPYDRPQIQALIALLRSAVSHEPVALEGYSNAERRLLDQELAKAEDAVPGMLVQRLITILGLASSPELQQLAGVLVRFKTIPSALQYFDDLAEQGFYDASVDAITLLTIHASKGLEFPHVFLIGAEAGILPSTRGDDAEERRLFYVAATRARDRLEILHARNRGGQKAETSHFITDVPSSVLQRQVDPDLQTQVRRIAKRAAKNSQTSLF